MKNKQYKNDDLIKWKEMSLLSGEIHIWVIRWKEITDFLSEYYYIMSEQEKEKITHFRFYEDQMRYATGKIATRLLLAQYLGVEDKEVQICKNEYGKLYHQKIDGKKSIQFNISHSGDIVLICFSYYPKVGVDVELIKYFPEYKDIARNFYTEEEALEVVKYMTPNMFYQYWTAKEAYLKAIGIGLAKGMDFFVVEDGFIKEGGSIKNDWRLYPIEIRQEYVACVAVQEKGVN